MLDERGRRLAAAINATDVVKLPDRVAEGARLLSQYQAKRLELERVAVQVEAFLADRGGRDGAGKSLADWAEEVLLDSDGPRRYREIAAEIHGRGFRHARTPKSPDQLGDSVWTAMYEDGRKRFVKVGRGVWDLASRHPDQGRSAAP